jgi:hypothetical protein
LDGKHEKLLEIRLGSVTLISAGMVCKNIRQVMAARKDHVTILGQFDPKLEMMGSAG